MISRLNSAGTTTEGTSIAAELRLFQRSAPYVIEKPDRPYRAWEKAVLRTVPGAYALSRARIYAMFESRALGFVKYPKLMGLM